jgi:phytoene/squalene synthetase
MSIGAMVPPAADVSPAAITKRSGSSFLAGFLCLDRERREAMTAIYGFCRVVDDAVDDAPDTSVGRAHLDFWRRELQAVFDGAPATPVGAALQAASQRFGVAQEPLTELVDGVAMDLTANGFATSANCGCIATASRRQSGSRACPRSARPATVRSATRRRSARRCS